MELTRSVALEPSREPQYNIVGAPINPTIDESDVVRMEPQDEAAVVTAPAPPQVDAEHLCPKCHSGPTEIYERSREGESWICRACNRTWLVSSPVRMEPPPNRQSFTVGDTTKRILLPVIGVILAYHGFFALSMSNQRCLDDLLPAPSCRTPSSLWVNPLTDAATLTIPKSAAFSGEDKDMSAGFSMGLDFVASNLVGKKLNDSARKYFDLYAMVLPYRVMVEEKDASERPLPFSLSVTSVSQVQADQQGHVMLFAEAHSKDGKNFVLVCHSAQPTCLHMRPGDYALTVLQPGDPYYAYDYTKETGAVVVRANVHREPDRAELVAVFTMVKRQTTP